MNHCQTPDFVLLVIRLYCLTYRYFNVIFIYKISLFIHLTEADLSQKLLVLILQVLLVSVPLDILSHFPFFCILISCFCNWACSSLALCLGKLSQVTDGSWALKNPGEVNFTRWNLLWCPKTHFHPILHSMELKVDKQLSGNWAILSSKETGELGWTSCGKIPTGDRVKSA